MARRARKEIVAPNQIYHIVARGNNERRIFRSSRDYRKFILILKDAKDKFPFYFYCFSLMPNHYHLQIETREVPISKIMHRINFLYAIYFKKRYRRSGHLFQDRFYSSPINKESYFWEAARYIDLNPVRANLAKSPEEWKWGSFRHYFYKEDKDNLLNMEKFLIFGGEDLEEARKNYIEYVKAGMQIKKTPDFISRKLV